MNKKDKRTREVILRYKGRIELSSPAERSRVESAAAKFFEQGGQYCASLVVAWPSRLEFNSSNRRPVRFSRRKLQAPPLTERQKGIVRELLMPMFLEFCESIASTEADREKAKKNKEQWEKAVYPKVRNEKEKAGSEFLRALQLAELYHRENPNPTLSNVTVDVVAVIRTVYATPLFRALIENNKDFLDGVKKQMDRSLHERQKQKKQLIELDELRHPTGPVPTWKSIQQKYCPDYKDSPENFQKLLRECGIPFAPIGEFDRKHVRNRKKNTCSPV